MAQEPLLGHLRPWQAYPSSWVPGDPAGPHREVQQQREHSMHISHRRRRQTGAEEAGDPDGNVLVCHLQEWSRSPAGEDMLAEDALVGGPRRGLQMALS